MHAAIDFILKIDERLFALAETYGAWVYGILFLVVFAETGLIVTPFLPGDSLLFAAGALCGAGLLNPWIMAMLLIAAAIIGDAVNYSVGRSLGPKVFSAHDHSSRLHRLLNREHLEKAHAFFEKHGGKAIVIARFVPIVRTFVPFVAGAGYMSYGAFAFYNVTGAYPVGRVVLRARLSLWQHSDSEAELLCRRPADHFRVGASGRVGVHQGATRALAAGRARLARLHAD